LSVAFTKEESAETALETLLVIRPAIERSSVDPGIGSPVIICKLLKSIRWHFTDDARVRCPIALLSDAMTQLIALSI
jgi:hypothetical protein